MNNYIDKITPVFTRTNLKILEELAQGGLYIREIAEKVGCSPAAAHKAVKLFKKQGFVKEKSIKNKVAVTLNYDNVRLQNIRSLLNIYKLTNCKGFKQLRKFGPAGTYGSFAAGSDDRHSDIDIWVYSEAPRTDLYAAARKIEQKLGKEVNLLQLTKKKLKTLREKDPVFYNQLKYKSIYFGGEVFV